MIDESTSSLVTESTPISKDKVDQKPTIPVEKSITSHDSLSSETSEEQEEEESIMKKRVEALILKLHPPEVDLIQEEMKALGLEDDPNIGIY